MKKVTSFIITALLALAMLTSCSEAIKETEATKPDENTPLTMEYLCEQCDLTPQDFEGIDFDAFVRYFKLTPENIEGTNIKFLINSFGEIEGDYANFEATTNTFEEGFIDQVKIIMITGTEPAGSEQFQDITIFDFEKGYIYYPAIIEVVKANNIIADIDDAMKEEILQTLTDCNITDWRRSDFRDDSVPGANGPDTGLVSRRVMTIVMNDGTVFEEAYLHTDDCDNAHDFYECIARLRQIANVA